MAETTSTQSNELKALLFVVAVFVTLLAIDAQTQYQWIQGEANAFASFVDKDSLDTVLNRANGWYHYINEEKGFRGWLQSTFIPQTDSENPAVAETNKLAPLLIRFADNAQNSLYLILYRASQFLFWGAILWPLAAAMIYDGYNKWVAKRFIFGEINTANYVVSRRGTWFIFSLTIIYVFSPIPLSSIAVLLPIAIVLSLSFAAKRLVTNFRKTL